VGDRYVLEMLQKNGGNLGGESSGHIICLDRTTTGDGIITALQVLAISLETGLPLHVLKTGMQKCPQRMINVQITPGLDILSRTSVQDAVREAEQQLNSQGRILLRPSGTEPLIRVMVEGVDLQQVETVAYELAEVVKAEANAQA
jgi:phosphoglucosamine mutase